MSDIGKRNLSGIVGTFLYMLIGLALTPSIQEMVTNVTGTGGYNLTGAAKALATLVPLFWVILIIGTGVYSITRWLD